MSKRIVVIAVSIVALDIESAIVLLDEAKLQITGNSIGGIIGGQMGECQFSVDLVDAAPVAEPEG